jgi:hypothetical protein
MLGVLTGILSWVTPRVSAASLNALALNCGPLSLLITRPSVFLMFLFITAFLITLAASLALAVRPIWLSIMVLSKASMTDIWKKNCFAP